MTTTLTIGVLSPVPGGCYYGNILAGITREVAAAGGRVVLLQTLDAGLSSDEVVSAPDFTTPTAWDHLDAVISIATATQRTYLDRVKAAGKAVALASAEIADFEAPSATPDNCTGVTQAVHHLIGHGHRRIGFAANLVQPDMRARYDAYRAALLARGIDPDPEWFFGALDNGELGGRDVARQLVAAGMPITALVLATDRNAIGCMAQLADLHLTVPDDLAVVGFDGVEDGTYTEPTLATVPQPYDEIGASAARLVLAQLRGDKVESRAYPSRSAFRPRGSCGCPDDAAATDTRFWREEATTRFARTALRHSAMREQYEIGIQLLDHEGADPKRLQWLAATDVRAAYLGLWEGGDRSSGRLLIAGRYDPGDVLADMVGTTCTIEQFPPPSLLALADPAGNEATIIVPVKARGLDFGLLAVAGEVDSTSTNGRETLNQWAALLTTALEQQDLVESVRTSEERYSLWAVATNDGLWDWDLTTDAVYYSGRCMELLGHPCQGARGRPSVWYDAMHPDDVDGVREVLRHARTGRLEPVAFEHRIRGTDGRYRCLSCRALPVGPPEGPATRIVGSLQDIERRKQLEEQLRHGALYDEVTGLPNRKLFLERLEGVINDKRTSSSLRYAVIFLDLDGFKLVNDSLGHLVGDRLLSHVGTRIRTGLRHADLAARFGGDEFAVLLHDLEPSGIPPIVERMQDALSIPMELDGHGVAVSASFGITTSEGRYTSAEDVLRDADIAMYHAKSHHRGSFAMFDAGMRATTVARLGLRSELRQAIVEEQFEVHYQPIVDLPARQTDRFEALVRWRHPRRGLVEPVDFLADMEETGLMVRLGRWIVEEVCTQVARWQQSYDRTVKVSINLSHREFWDEGLLPHILDCLRRHRLSPANLTLEITESVIMRKPDLARVVIDKLHTAGIGVQIDNFGTAYSSLHALNTFPIEALKIDRTFIQAVDGDPRTAQLMQIIFAMGETLGIDVVAEGVETETQVDLLRQIGCRRAQGFWFTKAVDADTAARMLGRSLPMPAGEREPSEVVAGVREVEALVGERAVGNDGVGQGDGKCRPVQE